MNDSMEMGKYLILIGFVKHRVNKKTKVKQVKITESGLLALELLHKLADPVRGET